MAPFQLAMAFTGPQCLIRITDQSVSLEALFAYFDIRVVLAMVPVSLFLGQKLFCAVHAAEGARLVFRHRY